MMTLVVAHRGAPVQAPENTMESFRLGAAAGADAIELDVHLTSDGHLAVIHDETVDRTTDGTGEVASFTLEDLRKLDAGARFTAADG
ncbi:MAG TPA: glycerophosphodiester phosphodiesterase family protein, partial [Candidatus Limnocylindria bacterium]